jgi:deoxycytidine triphosphate deaminase
MTSFKNWIDFLYLKYKFRSYKKLWQHILGEHYQDKYIFDYDDYKLSGGGGDYPTYDLALAEDIYLTPEHSFSLSHIIENIKVPNHVMLLVMNKSTIARIGINGSQCTLIDNGFEGNITLEITTNNRCKAVNLVAGMPIVQIVAIPLMFPATPYHGKYQGQPNRVVGAS